MSLPSRSEAQRDADETAEYERHVEEGYKGTFLEWLSARMGEAPTQPCLDAPGPDDIDF